MISLDDDNAKLVISAAVVGLLFILIFLLYNNHTKERDTLINNHLDHSITQVEDEGYVSDDIRFDIELFVDKHTGFSWVEVKGTESKVNKGEDVYLTVEMGSTGLFGGKGQISEFFKKGTAK